LTSINIEPHIDSEVEGMCARKQSNPRPKFDLTLLKLQNLEKINTEYSSHLKGKS
jgi:hypothetical protein